MTVTATIISSLAARLPRLPSTEWSVFHEREKDRAVSRNVLAVLIGSTFRPKIVNAPAHARGPVLTWPVTVFPATIFHSSSPFFFLFFYIAILRLASSGTRRPINYLTKCLAYVKYLSRARSSILIKISAFLRIYSVFIQVSGKEMSSWEFRFSETCFPHIETRLFRELNRVRSAIIRLGRGGGGINKFRGHNRLARSYRVRAYAWGGGGGSERVRVVCKTRAG